MAQQKKKRNKRRSNNKARVLIGTKLLQDTNKSLENYILEIINHNEPTTNSFFNKQRKLLETVNKSILDVVSIKLKGATTPEEIYSVLIYTKEVVAKSLACKSFTDSLKLIISQFKVDLFNSTKSIMDSIKDDIRLSACILPNHIRTSYVDRCLNIACKSNEEYITYVIEESNDLLYTYRTQLVIDINKLLSGLAVLAMEEDYNNVKGSTAFYYLQESLRPDIRELLSNDNQNLSNGRQLNSNIKYIDDYRELNSLAERHGYVHKRDNGDHGIFINNECKVIVIPQGRRVGKGLSIHIQKAVLSG